MVWEVYSGGVFDPNVTASRSEREEQSRCQFEVGSFGLRRVVL